MSSYCWQMFITSLGITLIVELLVAFSFGIRKWKGFLLVIMVNILTNPAAVATTWGIRVYFPNLSSWLVEIPIEGIVIFIEGLVYVAFAKESKWQIGKPWRMSIISNGASWMVGLALQCICN